MAYPADPRARTGNPNFFDPKSGSPEGYRRKTGSEAIDAGVLLYENQRDFWHGVHPHRPKTGVYDMKLMDSEQAEKHILDWTWPNSL